MTNHPTRRAFLQSAPLAAAIATPVGAAIPPELPIERVNRLAAELAEALNDYADGRMHAVVYPSEGRSFPIGFIVTDQRIPPKITLKAQIENTKTAMAKAYPDSEIHAYTSIDEDTDRPVLVFVAETVEG